jgi:hypothetical protein
LTETAQLSAPSNTLRIEYSMTEMEKIRQKVCEGLLALPRVGIGVGGLLIGESLTSEGSAGEGPCLSVRVLGSIDLPCSHAAGPAFRLTAEEIQQSRELMARSPGAVVGWYCSKTRGAATVGEAELALHRDLFPEPGRIALMVRPSTIEPTHAAFFYTDRNGKVVKGIESDLDELVAEEDSEKDDSKEDTAVVDLSPLVEVPQPASPVEPEPEAAVTAEMRQPAPTGAVRNPVTAPSFGYSDTAPRQRRRFRWIAGIVILLAGVLAFLTQNLWLPRPPLKLAVSEAGGVLTIRWNASAVRGIHSASLFVNDGGKLRTLPLDGFVLKRGFLAYEPSTVRVTATLAAGDSRAMIAWFAPISKPAPDLGPLSQPAPQAAPVAAGPAGR